MNKIFIKSSYISSDEVMLNNRISEMKNGIDYYRLYEYTDDICVLEDNPLYPGLLNYVKTGLLTKEELIDALEYDKDLDR